MAFPPVPFQEWFLRQTSAGNAALNAYVARVKADGGVVEAIGCVPLAVWDWVAPVVPTYGPEVTAWIARLNTEGFTLPSAANLSLLDTFVSALKSAGAWTGLDVVEIWAQDSNSADAGRVNLVSPSDTLATLYNAITFTNKVGVQGDGVSAYIDTGYNPSTYGGNYVAGDNFNAVWVNSAATGITVVMGQQSGSSYRIYNASTSNHRAHCTISGTNDLSGTGWIAANKSSTTAGTLFKDTTANAFSGGIALSIDNVTRTLLRSVSVYSDAGISIYMAGANQTANNTAVRTAVNNYLTAVASL